MSDLLKVENLCKGDILHNVTFSIAKGEMTAVMGPSGSGKSTLLYSVSGMDIPTSGSVVLDGEEITAMSEDERSKLRLSKTGFVFQQMNMLGQLDILDNVILPAVQLNKGKHRNKQELRSKALSLMEKLSVKDIANRRIWEVSGGQLQRACICRSIINNPALLFADEPTGALNKSASDEVMSELTKLNMQGTSILMVTHDSRAAACCERVLYLIDGKICGEIYLGKYDGTDSQKRENELKAQLSQLGW